MCQHWMERDWDVEVISAQPSYRAGSARRPRRELLGRLPVNRVPVVSEARVPAGKLMNLVVFPMLVGLRLLRTASPDVIMCSTAPQVTLGAVVSRVAQFKGAQFIYHCMDLHPEIGKLSGEFAQPLVYKALMAMDTATMRRSSAIVVLSDDMRRAVLDRDPALESKVHVLNNFELPQFDEEPAQSPLDAAPAGTVRVVFTGNIGRFQGLDKVMRGLAAAASEQAPIQFVLMGSGAARDELQVMGADLESPCFSVVFVSQGSPASAKELMRTAHLGVVSLQPEVIRYAYPSKTATYTATGLPLLVVCEQDSELVRMVQQNDLGLTAWTEAEIAHSVSAAAADLLDANAFAKRRRAVEKYAEAEFGESVALSRWDALLNLIESTTRRGRLAHG